MLLLRAAGDIKTTRMIIYGALLGVLDQALTIAAAAGQSGEVVRVPAQWMVERHEEQQRRLQEFAAASRRDPSSTDGASTEQQPQGSGQLEKATVWLDKAYSMQRQQALRLSAASTSDHMTMLAAFKV